MQDFLKKIEKCPVMSGQKVVKYRLEQVEG